jgi:hypothetical protein
MKTIRTLIVIYLALIALNCLAQPSAVVHPPGLTNRISPDETGYLLPGAWTNGLAVVPRVVPRDGLLTDNPNAGGPGQGHGGVEPLRSAPGCATVPGVVGWWRGEGDALDALGLNNGTPQGGVAFAAGMVDYAFNLNGSSAYVDVPGSASLNPSAAVTVEAWIYPTPPLDAVAAPIVKKAGEGLGTDHGYSLELYGPNAVAFWVFLNGSGWIPSPAPPLPPNQWSHVAGVYDGTYVRLYLNGHSVDLPTYAPSFIVGSGNHLQIGHDPSNPLRYFHGQIDEPSVYNTALSAAQILAIYNAGSVGKCLGPVIVTQPQSQQVLPGANVTLSVAAGGLPTLSYQWYRNGTIRAGATASTLTLPNVQATDAGTYNVVVSNPYGSAVSDNAVLTVYVPSCVQPPTGLVGWWAGEGNANDSFGVNNGTFQPVPTSNYGAGTVGQAFDLDGSSRYVDIGNGAGLSPTTAITIEGWIYPRLPLDPVGAPVLKKAGGGGYWGQDNGYSLELAGSSGVWFWVFLDGGRGWTPSPVAPLSANRWSHVAGVFNGASISIYVDGVLVGTPTAVTGQIVSSAHNLQIGHDSSNPRYFNGLIDEASLYTRALLVSEIQAIYAAGAAGKCRPLTPLEAWLQYYFGPGFRTDPNAALDADPDQDGTNNYDEWVHGTDPNRILFMASFLNDHVTASALNASVVVQAGVAYQMAVLVNSTNFTTANWVTYSPTVPVSLGPANGWYDVWIGLKGDAPTSVQTWQGYRVMRDTATPTIYITSPLGSTVSRPVLQVQGYSTEPLASISYDIANSAGNFTGLEGYVVRQWFDTNSLAFTTNWFECVDIPLTNGVNSITLHATDLAGNVANYVTNYTLDYSGVSQGPALTLYWPKDGAQVSGTSFTLRGLLDDPTATVTARITDANNVTSEVEGLVERSGLLWVENLPLGPGANTLTLSMTNAAGKPNLTSLTVIQSDVVLTIGDLSTTDLNQPFINVGGSINAQGYTVWVNGRQATPSGGQTWQALNVPVCEGGSAVIQARAIPNTDHGGQGTGGSGGTVSTMANPGNPSSSQARDSEAGPDKPPVVVQIHYDKKLTTTFAEAPPNDYQVDYHETIKWDLGRPGSWFWDHCWGGSSTKYFEWDDSDWNASGVGTSYKGRNIGPGVCGARVNSNSGPYTAPTTWPDEFCQVCATRDLSDEPLIIGHETCSRSARTRYELRTNGKPNSTRHNLFVLSATVTGIGNDFWPETDNDPWAYDIPPSAVMLGTYGPQGSDGRIYKVLADNTTHDITPRASGHLYYTFNQPSVKKHRLLLWAGTAVLEPNRVVQEAKFCVGQQIVFTPAWRQSSPYDGEPQGVSSRSYDWVMSSKYVNRKSQPNSAGCVTYDVDPNAQNQWMAVAWYVKGGDKNVTLNLTLQFNNGQNAKVTESGRFNVFRPDARPNVNILTGLWYSDPRNATLNSGGNFTSLQLDANNAMDIKTEIKSQFPGVVDYVQLIQGWNQSDIFSRPFGDVQPDSADKTVPYGDAVPIGTGYWAPAPQHRDGPETYGGYFYVEASYIYQVYLRFTPTGNPFNIPVTLARVDWHWHVRASRPDFSTPWTITINDCPPPIFQDDNNFPFWLHLYSP